jgi:hypothetical protein
VSLHARLLRLRPSVEGFASWVGFNNTQSKLLVRWRVLLHWVRLWVW